MKRISTALVLTILCLGAAPLALAGSHEGGCKGGVCHLKSGDSKCSKSSDCDKSGEYTCPITSKVMKKAHFFLSNKEEIGLSDDQVMKIKAIKYEAKKAAIRAAAEMKVFEIDLKTWLSAKPVDQAAINAQLDKAAAGWSAGAKASVQQYLDVKAVLTEAQMKKAIEIWHKQ